MRRKRREARSVYRFTVNTYRNRKLEERVAVLMSESDARILSQGTEAAIGALMDALATELWEPRPDVSLVKAMSGAVIDQ